MKTTTDLEQQPVMAKLHIQSNFQNTKKEAISFELRKLHQHMVCDIAVAFLYSLEDADLW